MTRINRTFVNPHVVLYFLDPGLTFILVPTCMYSREAGSVPGRRGCRSLTLTLTLSTH